MRGRLRADLVSAMRDRDRFLVATIRTLISAIENSEAVDSTLTAEPKIGINNDQPRKSISDDDIATILRTERAEFADAAAHYRELGLTAEAAELEMKVTIVDRYLDE